MSLSTSFGVLCQVDCAAGSDSERRDCGGALDEDGDLDEPLEEPWTPHKRRSGLVSYSADSQAPLLEPPLRSGQVWHLRNGGRDIAQTTLTLHPNGFCVSDVPVGPEAEASSQSTPPAAMKVAWSPFSLVQACRLHSTQADRKVPHMRLFKVSIFHHGLTHIFATQGATADAERARWVADVSRAIRRLTQSLFPAFGVRVEPAPGAIWTARRLLAGYLMLYDELGVSCVYAELQAHLSESAAFFCYEDESCATPLLSVHVDMSTPVSERVGVDCSCFGLGEHHFSARTCQEKVFWLRAISNVKVKLRHGAEAPTPADLRNFRRAVLEQSRQLLPPDSADFPGPAGPLLPRRGAAEPDAGAAAGGNACNTATPAGYLASSSTVGSTNGGSTGGSA